MPGIDGTLIDETYDLGVLAGDDPYELAWPYVTAFTLAVAPEVFALITPPLIVFIGSAAPAAVLSAVDLLTWEGTAALTALTMSTRPLLWAGESALAGLASTVDLLTWDRPAAHAALTSAARGGG